MNITPLVMILTFACGADDSSDMVKQEDEIGVRYYVYKDADLPGLFVPSGVMPDGAGVLQDTASMFSPRSGTHCIRTSCQLSAKPWVGVYFLLSGKWRPSTNCNLFSELGAKKGDTVRCRFWARSKDQAIVQFKIGGVLEGQVSDSLRFPASLPPIKLTPEWKMYEIDLSGKDLTSLVGGFLWTCERANNGDRDVNFDLDEIYFTKVKDPRTDRLKENKQDGSIEIE